MDAIDLAVRRLIYAHFGRTGQAISRRDLAAALDRALEWVDERLGWLADERVVALAADGEIARALPFCAAATPFVVRAGGVTYHANCAWDAFGVAALAGPSAAIDLACGDCGEALDLEPPSLVHFGVPPASWWDDIGFT